MSNIEAKANLDQAYSAALLAACALPTPAERRQACDAAHAKYETECEAAGIDLAD